MAELDERLNQLIADPEQLRKVLDMANAILEQREGHIASGTSPDPASPAPVSAAADASPSLSALLEAVSPKEGAGQSASGAPFGEISPLAAMLPQLMGALSGQQNLVKSERVELLHAMRPYLKEGRLSSIERALKMANLTKAATSALHLLGR